MYNRINAYLKTILAFWLTLLLFTVFAGPTAAADPLNINMGFAKDSIQGRFQIQVVGLVLDEAGLEHNFIRRPAARALYNVDKGLADGMILRIAGLSQLYSNVVIIPTAVVDYEFEAFLRSDLNRTIKTWDDLEGLNVGIVIGWKIVERNTKHVTTLTKVENGERLFQLLGMKRFDVVIYERWQGLEIARSLNVLDIKVGEKPLAVEGMHLYLNKRHANLVGRLDALIQKMQGSKQYADIYAHSFKPLSQWAQAQGIHTSLR